MINSVDKLKLFDFLYDPIFQPTKVFDMEVDPDKKNYLLRVFTGFQNYLMEMVKRGKVDAETAELSERFAAFDLITGSTFLMASLPWSKNIKDPANYYGHPLVAWAWVVDHSSKGDVNREQVEKLVELTIERVDKGEIVGVSPEVISGIDIGCAQGRDQHWFAKHPRIAYLGIDTSRPMIEIAQTINPESAEKFAVGNILNLKEITPEKQAWVFASAVIHHFGEKKKKKVVRQVRSVLADGGLFFMKVRYGTGKQGDDETGLFYYRETEDSVTPLLEKRGFGILSMYKTGSVRGIQYLNVLAEAIPQKL